MQCTSHNIISRGHSQEIKNENGEKVAYALKSYLGVVLHKTFERVGERVKEDEAEMVCVSSRDLAWHFCMI